TAQDLGALEGVILQVRILLVVEIVEERGIAPEQLVLAELAGVAAHRGLDGEGVLQQALALGVRREQRPGARAGNRQQVGKVGRHRWRSRNSVMMIALVKSMKKAPTIGTTRKARGAAPKRCTIASMFAIA